MIWLIAWVAGALMTAGILHNNFALNDAIGWTVTAFWPVLWVAAISLGIAGCFNDEPDEEET